MHVALLIPGYDEADKRYVGVGFLYLDHTIGEYNTIMHIGHIKWMAFEQVPANAHLINFEDLRPTIETKFYGGFTLRAFRSKSCIEH